MIISIHIPKTAGASFRKLLNTEYDKKLQEDYGDMPSALEYRKEN